MTQECELFQCVHDQIAYQLSGFSVWMTEVFTHLNELYELLKLLFT